MALSFIGKRISLISRSSLRYEGTLAGIDPEASTIQLSDVYSMGTETRSAKNFITPNPISYASIVFRASEVKELSALPSEPAIVHEDPAILRASAHSEVAVTPASDTEAQEATVASVSNPASPKLRKPQATQSRTQQSRSQVAPAETRAGPPVDSVAQSLFNVGRALSDLRQGQNYPLRSRGDGRGRGTRGTKRGRDGYKTGNVHDIAVPKADFDFQSSNAKFSKNDGAPPSESSPTTPGVSARDEETPGSARKTDEKGAYNPNKSFFDTLSSSAGGTTTRDSGGQVGRGRGMGRTRREEEREKNVATFGEPGGLGLMGRGAYVGGWGGYGPRGGRSRRGGGRGDRGTVDAQVQTPVSPRS